MGQLLCCDRKSSRNVDNGRIVVSLFKGELQYFQTVDLYQSRLPEDEDLKVLRIERIAVLIDRQLASELARYARALRSLNRLEFEGVTITPEAARVLTSLFRNTTAVKELSLNDINNEALKFFLKSLKTSTSVTTLTIVPKPGSIYGYILDWLSELLTANSNFTAVEFTNVRQLDIKTIERFSSALRMSTNLKRLNCAETHLGSDGIRRIIKAVISIPSLTELNLRNAFASDTGPVILNMPDATVAAIVEILCANSLTSLDIANNRLTPANAKLIATAVHATSVLARLCISENRIGAAGAAYFAEALKGHKSLKILEMCDISAGLHEFFEPFKNVLKNNTSLTELSVTIGADKHQYDQLKLLLDINASVPPDSLQYKYLLPEEFLETLHLGGAVDYITYVARREEWRMKLMFLGDGRIGKTTLLRYLKEGKVPEDMKSTEGIDIDMLSLDISGVETTTWDFGGQMEYHVTHQHFLSAKNAVYILCFSLQEYRIERVEYWLKWIYAQLGSSTNGASHQYSIILVGLKADAASPSTIQEAKSNAYSLISSFYMLPIFPDPLFVSSFSHSGREELLNTLVEVCRRVLEENVGTRVVPAAYQQVYNVVCELQKGQTSDKLGLQLISQIFDQLPDHPVSYHNFCDSIAYLHHVGVVVKIDDYVCVNPQWVTKVLALFISPQEVRKNLFSDENIDGFMSFDQIAAVLRKHDMGEPNAVVKLMESTEICYEIRPRFYMFPSLLPTGELHLSNRFSQVLGVRFKAPNRYTIVPTGLFCSLQVSAMRTWKSSDPDVTNNYVVVHNVDSCEVLIHREVSYIDVAVTGSNPKQVLSVMLGVQRMIENIAGKKYKGLLINNENGATMSTDEGSSQVCLCPMCTKEYYCTEGRRVQPLSELSDRDLQTESVVVCTKRSHFITPGDVVLGEPFSYDIAAMEITLTRRRSPNQIRILTINCGDVKSLALLQILSKIETLARKPIHQLFDLICGTSMGAILAIAIGRLGMKLDKCDQICRNIFPHASERLGKYDSIVFEAKLQQDFLPLPLYDDDNLPKVFVTSVPHGDHMPVLFRSYDVENSKFPDALAAHKREVKCWQAACASAAGKTLFGHHFGGGEFSCENLTAVAIAEARQIWRKADVACVVALGPGLHDMKVERKFESILDPLEALHKFAALDVPHQNPVKVKKYYNINPARVRGKFADLNNEDLHTLSQISTNYCQYSAKQLASIVKHLRNANKSFYKALRRRATTQPARPHIALQSLLSPQPSSPNVSLSQPIPSPNSSPQLELHANLQHSPVLSRHISTSKQGLRSQQQKGDAVVREKLKEKEESEKLITSASSSKVDTDIRILFVESNPSGMPLTQANKAFRELQKIIPVKDLVLVPAASWESLQNNLGQVQPTVLHIWAHGERDGDNYGIVLSNFDHLALELQKEMNDYTFCPAQLAALVKEHASNIQYMVLSVCQSAEFVEEVYTKNPHCKCIGFKEKVNANYMISWCVGFYKALLSGNSFHACVKAGLRNIKINPLHSVVESREREYQSFKNAMVVKPPKKE